MLIKCKEDCKNDKKNLIVYEKGGVHVCEVIEWYFVMEYLRIKY
jgi:hypothetical protein